MNLQVATRKQAKIKLGLQSPAGGGKTYSALLLAYGLINDWTKIAVIDTENHSADLYAHLGNYQVLAMEQPFSPERYIEAIEICEKAGMAAVIIDSISHEWEGTGGILDIHGSMMGNSFTNWSKVTPRHNDFVQKILQSKCHIIATIRSKQDYVLSDKNGKMVPEKIGLKGVTREGMDYEFTLVFELDLKHQATATKDRTGLFMDKPQFVISAETGQRIANWCNTGRSIQDIRNDIQRATTVDQLRDILRAHPDYRSEIEPLCINRKSQIDNPIAEVNHP
ncbi:MAG: AAA family ATPase [Mariniphaga sp.]